MPKGFVYIWFLSLIKFNHEADMHSIDVSESVSMEVTHGRCITLYLSTFCKSIWNYPFWLYNHLFVFEYVTFAEENFVYMIFVKGEDIYKCLSNGVFFKYIWSVSLRFQWVMLKWICFDMSHSALHEPAPWFQIWKRKL